LEAVSQLILRSRAALADGPLLLVNPEPDALFRELGSAGRSVRLSTGSHGVYRTLAGQGADIRFEPHPGNETPAGHVILVLPREKERLAMLLHAAGRSLQHGGRLWLAGPNRAGAKSAPATLKRYFDHVVKRDAARRCSLYEASGPNQDEPFELTRYARRWQLRADGPWLVSLPGVFARERLDAGSALLLGTFNGKLPRGRLLDFGCGNGVLTIALLAAGAEIDAALLDDSALALEASRLGLEMNDLRGRLLASNGLSEVDGAYDWIISNPPFHRGVDNDLDIAAHFFRRAGTFLSENGRIRVVFNRHLPYEAWLRESFGQVDRLAANRSFTVLQASKPR
jgi:16S rRNA (guanine1207-N2)-methyltransferase